MAKKLVIVESGAKARTISRYLGREFTVQHSRGHVRDLPADQFGVDVENDFEPTYRVLPRSEKVVAGLRKAAAGADEVYLAPDPDREGEAIAWHLKHLLELPEEKVKRVTFNEVTRGAVREAFEHARDIDLNLVNAQQARRILDRIVGYELSPLISKKVVRGLSAGRVQSVALRLVVERERERDAFESKEYWEVKVVLSRPGESATFEAELRKFEGEDVEIATAAQADKLVGRLKTETYKVASVKKRATRSKAPAPFITSTLQQAANNRLGFTAQQTMRIAQQLYEGVDIGTETVGLITYMRTDSTRVAKQALGACRRFIGQQYGDDYVPEKPNVFRSPKGAQAAHEAVRPTDTSRRPEDVRPHLSDRQYKLYELVWRRFVASQMTPARFNVTDVQIQAGPGEFKATGRQMTFDGFRRVLPLREESGDQVLPELQEGQLLDLKDLVPSQHFTQPPARYTEATLVRELEKQGIGRPSTYAPTISTLLRRNYVRRERRALRPTDLGVVVADLLVEHFPREMDVSFTSKLEEELDEVEEGKRQWRKTLADFYGHFSRDLEKAKAQMQSVSALAPPEEVLCEKCGRPMVVKFSRMGDRFLGCPGFPECKSTKSLSATGAEEPVETEFKCDKCGAPMVRRTGRKGREYLACSAYPDCRNIMGLDRDGKPVKLEPRQSTGFSCPRCGQEMHVKGEGTAGELTCGRCKQSAPMLTLEAALEKTEFAPDERLGVCDKCGAPMGMKRGRKGLFLACSGYPDCKNTSPVPKDVLPGPQPTHEVCEKCGRPMVMRWGQFGRFLACSGFPRCRNTWRVPARRRECPVEGCKGELIKKVSPEGGEYCGCTRYPECEHTEPVPQRKKGKGKG
ncbi:MAG: type I DNA topoisomerase [Candidatus Brocadiae bacterium]|nr:type I DNA topoisomerase [Candidatus Brocadiia bacterium]